MTNDEPNPYAPPAEASPMAELDPGLHYFSDGTFLIVRDGAELPDVCVRTNAPAGPGAWRRKVTLTWTPPWVFVLILVNLLVLLIVMLVIQKKGKVVYSLSAPERARIVKRRGIGFFLLLAAVVAIVAGSAAGNDDYLLGGIAAGVLLLIGSLAVFAVANPIRVLKFRDGWFRVKGCSPGFLESLPQRLSPF